jgi:hypothetical protein
MCPLLLKISQEVHVLQAQNTAFDEAINLLTKWANDGHSNSMAELGHKMYYGDRMERDKAGGLDMLRNTAKDGLYIAHYILGAIIIGDDDGAAQ